jgi:hypothetical protein
MKLILLGALLCGGLFVAALAFPRRSLRPQRWVARKLRGGERRASGRDSGASDLMENSLRQFRGACNKSAGAGRQTRDKLPV